MALTADAPPRRLHVATSRIPSLDGVRGFAILVVVVHNASWILTSTDRFPLKLLAAVTATGWIGVQLFFVLSGFLITGILMETRHSEDYFRNFYLRRVLRIFPLYYAFLALALWVFPLVADPEWTAVAKHTQLWYWTYMSNWASPFGHSIPGLPHFWSLAVEEQFYLFWPVLVLALSRRALTRLCVAVIVAGPFIRLALNAAGLPRLVGYEFTVSRWDALAGGALLAILMVDEPDRTWLHTHISRIGALSIVSLLAFVFFVHGFHEGELTVQVLGQTITVLLFGWFVGVAASPTNRVEVRLRDALTARWLRFLGKYSYGIYVLHYPVHTIASRYLRDSVNGADSLWRLLRWAGYVGGVGTVSIILALGSWHAMEKHFLDLKRRWAPRTLA